MFSPGRSRGANKLQNEARLKLRVTTLHLHGNSFQTKVTHLKWRVCDMPANLSFYAMLKLKCYEQCPLKPDTQKQAGNTHHLQIQEYRHAAHWCGLSSKPADTLADVPRAFPSLWGCSVKCRHCLWAPVIALASLFEGVYRLGAPVLMQHSYRKSSEGSLRPG